MTLNEFVEAFGEELESSSPEQLTVTTNFKSLPEWGSLMALSIIGIVDDAFDKSITGADLRSVDTIEELYNLIQSK